MNSQPEPAAAIQPSAAVALQDLRTVLLAHKLRRISGQHLCSLAVTTPSPFLEVDCGTGLRYLQSMRQTAMRLGGWKSRVQPLSRGHVSTVFERVQAAGRRAEVLRTWRTGIASLRKEPRFVLHLPLCTHLSASAWGCSK